MLHWERPAKHWAQGPVGSLPILPACRHKGYVIICIIWSVVNRLICTHNISKVGRHHHVLRLWLHADDHLFAWEMGLCQRLTASTFSLESLCWALSINGELDCRLKPRLAFLSCWLSDSSCQFVYLIWKFIQQVCELTFYRRVFVTGNSRKVREAVNPVRKSR